MLTTQNILLLFSALLSALIMGLLYGFTCAVNPGLHKLNDGEYIKAMQSINIAIVNPAFLISFLGTLIILPITTWYSKSHATSLCFYVMMAATITYIAGVICITAFGNIPLNNSIAGFDVSAASTQELLKQRTQFESSWNNWHLVRTIFSIITTVLTLVGIITNVGVKD